MDTAPAPRHEVAGFASTEERGDGVIRVLIAEDMHLIRGAIVALLSLEEDMEVVAELESGDKIVDTALLTRPDVAVIDIELPHLHGLSAADLLHQKLPERRTLILPAPRPPLNHTRALHAHLHH